VARTYLLCSGNSLRKSAPPWSSRTRRADGWYQHHDGEAVRALTRVEPDGDRVARLHNDFFNPDFIARICGELGVRWRSNGYRWFLPKK